MSDRWLKLILSAVAGEGAKPVQAELTWLVLLY